MGRDKRWEASWLRKRREGQRRQLRSIAVMGRQAGLPGPTWNSSGGGCRRHLRPLLLRLLPLPLLLLLLLLDETEVGAAELGSSGRGDQPRLQQHRGQAEQQGTRDAPAEPRHGREPEGRGGILRGSRRPRTPGLLAPAAPARSSLPRPARAVCFARSHQEREAGEAAEGKGEGEEGEVSILAHVMRGAGRGEHRASGRGSAVTPGGAAPRAPAPRSAGGGGGGQCRGAASEGK